MRSVVLLAAAACGIVSALELEFKPIPQCTEDCHNQANLKFPAPKALVCQQDFVDFVYPCFAPLCTQEEIDVYTNDIAYTCGMYGAKHMPVVPKVTPGKASKPTTTPTPGPTTLTKGTWSNKTTTCQSPQYTTKVVTAYTTYCPGATVITHKDMTYTATGPTTLTITNCPCTITVPVTSSMMSPTPMAYPTKYQNATTSKPSAVTAGAPAQQGSYTYSALCVAIFGLMVAL